MSIGQSERGHSSVVVSSSQMTSLCQGTDATHIHVCIHLHPPHTHIHLYPQTYTHIKVWLDYISPASVLKRGH